MIRRAAALLAPCFFGGIAWSFVFGCGGAVPHPPFSPQATTALEPIDFDPPPGRVELIPKRPSEADAWVDGEWILRHGRWYWLLGRWVKTPPGATYSPWVVVRSIDGSAYYAPSVWKDAKGAPIHPPPALAFATASGEAVVDAEGDTEKTGRAIKTAPPKPPPEPSTAPASGAPSSGASSSSTSSGGSSSMFPAAFNASSGASASSMSAASFNASSGGGSSTSATSSSRSFSGSSTTSAAPANALADAGSASP